MQNKENNIDGLFKNNLENFEVNPPPVVWDNIAQSMGHTRKRRAAILIWSLSGAASLFFAFLLGWYLAGNNHDSDDFYSQLEDYRNNQPTTKIVTNTSQQNIILNFKKTPFQPLFIAEIDRKNKEEETIERENTDLLNLMVSAEYTPLYHRKLDASLIPSDDEFSASDRAIVEANMLAYNDIETKDNEAGWSVGVQASPMYMFEKPQLVAGNNVKAPQADLVQNNVATDYQSNVSGGLSFAYETGKKLSFITGVNYATVAQNGGAVGVSFAGHNWVNNRYDMAFDETETSNKMSNLTSKSSNAILNTEVGLANIEMPDGAQLASSNNMNTYVPNATQNYNYQQQAGYIEIPMLMKYQLIDKLIGVHLLGGVNTNILITNVVQLKDNKDILATGHIEGLRPYTFSSSMGMGVNYSLTSRLKFSLEPTLKIYLNTLNELQYVNAKPYAFGVYSGVTFQF